MTLGFSARGLPRPWSGAASGLRSVKHGEPGFSIVASPTPNYDDNDFIRTLLPRRVPGRRNSGRALSDASKRPDGEMMRRTLLTFFVAAALSSIGCESTSYDNGPAPVCVSVAGVWDVAMTAETATGIVCPDRSVVWTLSQNGCNVTIQSESWDSANGATGGVTDNRVYVDWIWLESCYRYHETLDVVVDGDTMTGTYYMFRGQAVYPAYCPGLGGCTAAVSGVRRAP